MTGDRATIDPSDRVRDYTERFARFLAQEVAPIEADLAQLESVTNIEDPETKAKIAAVVATLNAVLAALPVSA